MQLIALSDLHIEGEKDPLYQSLLAVIRTRLGPEDVLVLAGDIFDFWVGDKALFRERYSDFYDAIVKIGRSGTQIYYIEGNHDFHLKNVFQEVPHFHLLTDEIDLEFGGNRFYIAHGDKVDTADYSYRILRALFRTHLVRAAVRAVPDRMIEEVGTRASRLSKKQNFQAKGVLPLQKMPEVRKKFRSYAAEKMSEGFDFVIMGHCHDDDEMRFRLGDKQGQYMNVGYPRVHGQFLVWKEGDPFIRREKLPEY